MDAISILTPAETIPLEDVERVAKGLGLSCVFLDRPFKFLNVYTGDEHKHVSPLCQVEPFEISRTSEGLGFEPEQLEQLVKKGMKSGLFIACHIDMLKRIQPLIKAVLVRWGGFVIFEEFSDWYTIENLEKYRPE